MRSLQYIYPEFLEKYPVGGGFFFQWSSVVSRQSKLKVDNDELTIV